MSKHASCPPTRASRIPTSSSNGVAAQAPSGTVTFLFTDIEGSTRLWEGDRVEMKAALARHDAILRDAIGRHNGFVFATGAGFAVAFARAGDALACAVEAQSTHGPDPNICESATSQN